MDEKHEECGVFGIYSHENRDVAFSVYYGLYALQHRGQESAGIAVAFADKFFIISEWDSCPTCLLTEAGKSFPKATYKRKT